MEKDLREMEAIQTKKAEETNRIPLDAEGKALAEHKRYTFDIVGQKRHKKAYSPVGLNLAEKLIGEHIECSDMT